MLHFKPVRSWVEGVNPLDDILGSPLCNISWFVSNNKFHCTSLKLRTFNLDLIVKSLINWFILSEEFFAMIVIWAIKKKDLLVSYQNKIWIDIDMKSDQIESRGMTECGVDRFMVCPCILHSNQVNQEPERNLICTKIWVKDRHT